MRLSLAVALLVICVCSQGCLSFFMLKPKGGRFSGGLAYAFSGLGNPTFSIAGEQGYSSAGFSVEEPVEGGDPIRRNVFLLERERELRLGATLVRRRVRHALTLSVSASYVWESRELLNDALQTDSVFVPSRPTSGLPQLGLTLGYNNSRFHPFSISREDGVSGFVRARRRVDATVPDSIAGTPGADASFTDVTGELRLYKAIGLPGFANHVLAVRASGGAAFDSGDIVVAGHRFAASGFYFFNNLVGRAF